MLAVENGRKSRHLRAKSRAGNKSSARRLLLFTFVRLNCRLKNSAVKKLALVLAAVAPTFIASCQKSLPDAPVPPVEPLVFGVDLSYVNQVEHFGGVFRDSGQVADCYGIFKKYGAGLVRLRLWHNPLWTKEVYGAQGTQMYSDLADVEQSIRRAKTLGMAVNLDFHYSDIWADPAHQSLPAAWADCTFETLKDSVYRYTFSTLRYLDARGLMPEMVQIGNEINDGMLWPHGKRDNVAQLGALLNAGIRAVRDAAAQSAVKPRIIIHVAQPENVEAWFDAVTGAGQVQDFDVIGFSYYSKWSTVALDAVDGYVRRWKSRYGKAVMLVETAYPWTSVDADSYTNLFSTADIEPGYPATPTGQYDYLVRLTQEVVAGGGTGVQYWEPAWITSGLKDPWGSGSSWDNCTLFDAQGNVLPGMGFMRFPYH